MQETTSKCRALFRPMLCVWLSLLLALSPALRPKQAKAIAFADDVGLALMVLSVLGYGVAAWQYSADQTSVDQLAATLSSFPTVDVGAAVHDGFLYVSELADSTIQQIGTWYNSAVNTFEAMSTPITVPEHVGLSLDGVVVPYLHMAGAPVGKLANSAWSQTLAQYPSAAFILSRYDRNYSSGQSSVAITYSIDGYTPRASIRPSGSNYVITLSSYRTNVSLDNTIRLAGSGNSDYKIAANEDVWVSPYGLQLLRDGGANITVPSGADSSLLNDIPVTYSPDASALRTGETAPTYWPDYVNDLGDVVVAPVPTETPTSVPSEDWGEWVWTPADDEALADWIERHKTGTTPDPDPDPEDPEDPEREAMPVPIPWWWPWDEPAEDVWPDIKQRIDEWTDPSFDPSPSADPDAGPGDGIGSLPANPDGPTPDPDPDKPTGDKTWDDIGYDLSHVFPFCLPFDLSRLLGLLVTDPVTPVLSWATPDPAGGNVMMSIDLTPWDPVAAAVRKVEILLFAAYLIVKTRDIMS